MATLEDELKGLKNSNNELVQKVQYWKMLAGQRENEKLNLMKENNEMRLKLSRLRSNGNVQASNLEASLQSASEKALTYLIRASEEITRSVHFVKTYMRDRQELDADSPRWSSISGTPNTDKKDKIHRVPPMMMGGQSIQPVVSLSRTMLDTSNPRSTTRSPNQNRNVAERAVPMHMLQGSTTRSPNQNRNVAERALPMHMLQDVYIPLTRIDARNIQTQNMETDNEANNADNSVEDLGLNDSEERGEDSEIMSEDEDFNSSRRLEVVTEDLEPEDEEATPLRSRLDNPLEGPSWMLDASTPDNQATSSKSYTNLEPDSTTELEDGSALTPPIAVNRINDNIENNFSPTVRRRRKRTSSPPPPTPRRPAHHSPRPEARRLSNSGRVLKVLVAKMSLEGGSGEAGGGDVSPPKRAAGAALAHFDAPSPNGATVRTVIVSETHELDVMAAGERRDGGERAARPRGGSGAERPRGGSGADAVRADSRASDCSTTEHEDSKAGRARRRGSRDSAASASASASRDSDSASGGEAEGRSRRPRKAVTYAEIPLNRKMRR